MSKARIFIIEDEQVIALDISNSLTALDYEIAGQTDCGEDAVNQVGKLRPDLILMDISLKGEMDGIEAATQIWTRFDIPIIFLTAFSDPGLSQSNRLKASWG